MRLEGRVWMSLKGRDEIRLEGLDGVRLEGRHWMSLEGRDEFGKEG